MNKNRIKTICSMLAITGIMMISVGATITSQQEQYKINTNVEQINIKDLAASTNMIVKDTKVENKQEVVSPLLTEVKMVTTPAAMIIKSYDEMTLEEKNIALANGTLKMEYSAYYGYSGQRLTVSRGAQYYNGHKETYYSQKVLPGTSLAIPGRHVADDGTIRDADGFVCVAADPGFAARGSILITSVGPAKVYDCGCAYGTIDIYVNW